MNRRSKALSGAQTGGEFSMIEAAMPPGGDGGLHNHTREDECVFLLEGELNVTVAEQEFVLKAGESYFVPRNFPHRLRNYGKTVARAMLINTPGTFDELVRKAGVPAEECSAPSVRPTPPKFRDCCVWRLTLGYRFSLRRSCIDCIEKECRGRCQLTDYQNSNPRKE